MTDSWQPISTAPRDGTEVELTLDPVDGELFKMRWFDKAQVWAMQSKLSGALLCTWSEADPDGAPTHWRPVQ